MSFGTPKVIETLAFEPVLNEVMLDAAARFTAAGVTYDVGNLEFDPVKILAEALSYRELNLRARINDAALTRVLPFAGGTDLDYLAAFYDVARMALEDDARLRKRVTLAISGRSTAGPAEWYIGAAMRASVRVKEAVIYRAGLDPVLTIAILSTDNGGLADAPLIAAVTALVTGDAVRTVSDRVNVIAAVSSVLAVEADIWLLPDAPQSIMDELAPRLRAALDAEGGLGFDLKRSWLASRLHQPGVARVDVKAPLADYVAGPSGAAAIGAVTLTYKGRDR